MSAYLSLELRRTLRDRRYMVMVVGWPVAAYLLFSTVFGAAANRAEGLGPRVEIMVAMAAFGAIGAVLLATGPKMAIERQSGWTRQLGLTPIRPTSVLATRVLAALILATPAIVLTFLAAFAVKGVSLSAWEWPVMGALLLVGTLPFAALGLVIGNITDGDSATGATMIVYVVLAVLGGLWIPTKILPAPMRTVAHALPSNQLAELGWRVAAGQAPFALSVSVLTAWTVGLSLVAVALTRRRVS